MRGEIFSPRISCIDSKIGVYLHVWVKPKTCDILKHGRGRRHDVPKTILPNFFTHTYKQKYFTFGRGSSKVPTPTTTLFAFLSLTSHR